MRPKALGVAFAWCAAATSLACDDGCHSRDRQRASAVQLRTSSEAAACPAFAKGQALGRVQAPNLTEISGVAMSKKNPGVLWVHNDSGHAAELFALAEDGHTL